MKIETKKDSVYIGEWKKNQSELVVRLMLVYVDKQSGIKYLNIALVKGREWNLKVLI